MKESLHTFRLDLNFSLETTFVQILFTACISIFRIENPSSLSLITRANGRLWRRYSNVRTDAIIVSSFPISKLEPLIQIGAASYSNPVELDLKKGPISLATCRQHPSFSLFEFPGLFVCPVPLRASISSELCPATSGRKLNVSARRVLIDTSRNTVAIPCRSHQCLRIVLVTASSVDQLRIVIFAFMILYTVK